ncbi:MAG: hypothetical protein J5777_07450 [Clostridiales bacterium]|nr:hypothetical protein [Clostridiales bacterium]
MKRLIPAAIALCVLMSMTSCAASNDTTPELVSGGQTKIAASGASAASDNNQIEDKYYLTYNGVKIVLGAETAPVVKAIGKEYVYTENPSCAYVGIDYTYDYKSFIIYAQTKDGKEFINTVEVRDNTVDCGGVKVGQTLDEAKKVFGTPSSDAEYGIIYVKNGTELQFIADDSGKIIYILYTNETKD